MAIGTANWQGLTDLSKGGDAGHRASFIQSVQAQNSDKPVKPQAQRIKTLSVAAGTIYKSAYDDYEAEKYDSALVNLNKIINGKGFNDYDTGKAYEMRAFIYADRGDYKSAIRDLSTAITPTDRLNPEEVLRNRYALAQLYLVVGDYSKAISQFEAWFAATPEPSAQAHMQFAQAYVLAGQTRKALPYAEKGFSMLTEPNENWYTLMSTIYIQLNMIDKAIPVLEKMVAYWPGKRDYYMQLSAAYSQKGRDKDSFAVLALAYDNGLVTESSDIVRLAQLYRYYGYPYKAAKILSAGINSGKVKKTKDNWEELGYAWAGAREQDKAVGPLSNAAKLSKDGKLYYRLCQTYFEDEKWNEAETNCRNAINKGGLDSDRGYAWFLLGNARYNLNKRDEAIEAFEKCQESESTGHNCTQWIQYINNEIANEKREAERKAHETEAAAQREEERAKESQKVLQQQKTFQESVGGSE